VTDIQQAVPAARSAGRGFRAYSAKHLDSLVQQAGLRPGDAIDLQVNSTRTPASLLPPSGPAAPLFTFRNSDFWVQGINFGMQVRY